MRQTLIYHTTHKPLTNTHTNKQYGTRYAVQLSNFAPGSQVNLKLFRKQVRSVVPSPFVCLFCLSVVVSCHTHAMQRFFVLSSIS